MKREKARDTTREFEEALANHSLPRDQYVIRLFVTGSTPRSLRAIQNVRAICEQRLQGSYRLEVIDIYQHPEHATGEQIVVTPTLVKKLPLPVRKIIGDLSDRERVLAGLNIVTREAAVNAAEEHRGD